MSALSTVLTSSPPVPSLTAGASPVYVCVCVLRGGRGGWRGGLRLAIMSALSTVLTSVSSCAITDSRSFTLGEGGGGGGRGSRLGILSALSMSPDQLKQTHSSHISYVSEDVIKILSRIMCCVPTDCNSCTGLP